jgi:hypothetical protein
MSKFDPPWWATLVILMLPVTGMSVIAYMGYLIYTVLADKFGGILSTLF